MKKHYLLFLIWFCLLSAAQGQLLLQRNDTFSVEVEGMKMSVRNMGFALSCRISANPDKMAKSPFLIKDNRSKRWIFSLRQGSLFSKRWQRAPDRFLIHINTPLGTLYTTKKSKMYITVREENIKCVLQRGRGEFVGSRGQRLTVQQTKGLTFVNLSVPLPEPRE